MEYQPINILDMEKSIGEEALQALLSHFCCPKNLEIENFIRKNALEFAKRKISITYLILDMQSRLAAIFTLTHKAVEIKESSISRTMQKKLQRFAQLDESKHVYDVSAFLIAQFGKNQAYTESDLSGNMLMVSAFDILKQVQHQIGGGVVYLECEDNPHLLRFYQNEQNRFHPFDERYSQTDQTRYLQLLRIF